MRCASTAAWTSRCGNGWRGRVRRAHDRRRAGLPEKLVARVRDSQRSYVTVGIGCTGGRHRSVYLVDRLAAAWARNSATFSFTTGTAGMSVASSSSRTATPGTLLEAASSFWANRWRKSVSCRFASPATADHDRRGPRRHGAPDSGDGVLVLTDWWAPAVEQVAMTGSALRGDGHGSTGHADERLELPPAPLDVLRARPSGAAGAGYGCSRNDRGQRHHREQLACTPGPLRAWSTAPPAMRRKSVSSGALAPSMRNPSWACSRWRPPAARSS